MFTDSEETKPQVLATLTTLERRKGNVHLQITELQGSRRAVIVLDKPDGKACIHVVLRPNDVQQLRFALEAAQEMLAQ